MARSLLSRIQRDAYMVSRAAGDVRAAQRGSDVLAKRLIRRAATRKAFSLLRALGR